MFKSSENLLMRIETEISYLTETIGICTDDDENYGEKSYQFVLTVLAEEKEKNDGSLSKEQFNKIQEMLEDESVDLLQAYWNILDFLFDICHS